MTKARDLANSADVFDTVSTTELGYLDGVSSAIQTQIDGKQAVVSGVDNTEIGYLDGVTSAIQTQLDGKVAASTVDAKGDLLAGSADNTLSRLAVGANDTVLTADSSTSTGLKWAVPSGFGTLTAYTPTFYGGTQGNGTFTDVGYSTSGDLVWYYGMFTFGSTSTASGSGIEFSLPINADPTASNTAFRSPIWNFAAFCDVSTGHTYPVLAGAQNATPSSRLILGRLLTNGTNLICDSIADGTSYPFVLATNDTIWWNIFYKKA